jgi:3-hydroxyisobutyrate dehydrogenase
MNIAFIGLGAMGRPMAEWLISEGFLLKVSDTNTALAPIFGEAWAASPAEAAQDADLVITMLPNGKVVRDVLVGSGGVVDVLKAGAIVVDTSSSEAVGTTELGAELAARHIPFIDAPVSGGVVLAGQGKLALMVGGTDEDAFEKARPVLEALSSRLLRVGTLGAGHAAKAINNAIAACIFAVTSEGLHLGTKFGLDAATLLEVINSSTGRSGVSEGLFPGQVLSEKYALGFALSLMAKDVSLAESLRDGLSLNLPLIEKTHAQYQDATTSLGASADFTEYHKFVGKHLGGE